MKETQLEEILQCLSGERRLFPYFKDRYALLLLADIVGTAGKRVSELKSSCYHGLLEKEGVKRVLQRAPGGLVTRDLLESEWSASTRTYRLTLGSWGGSDIKHNTYYQTSRAGKNLVLQMNFPFSHNRDYERLIKPEHGHPFQNVRHPIASGDEQTLAWARIDLDFDTGEALIEEIQCDWIRGALGYRRASEGIEKAEARNDYLSRVIGGRGSHAKRFTSYINDVLTPHIDIWEEAMLSAALWFVTSEIGIRTLFYHTFEGADTLKVFGWKKPPRSIYTTLPRRFCFQRVDRGPSFLRPKRMYRPRRGKNREEPVIDLPSFHLLEL
jgi:hypothetical protein